MTGTYAYLVNRANDASLSRTVAGLNLDMVGEDQEQCGSVLLIDSPPEASASFVVSLLERIREELFDQGESFSQRGRFPLLRYATVPFSGGSDHFVFSDPTVGVPMPMLIQWPDRFYHTSADTLDKVSPEEMKRSCLLAGTYAYWLATAGARQVEWLAHEMMARFKHDIISHLQKATTDQMADPQPAAAPQPGPSWRQRLDYWVKRQETALDSLCRLQPDFDPKPWSRAASFFANSEWAVVGDILKGEADPENSRGAPWAFEDDDRAGSVPRRVLPGPISVQSLLRYHPPELAERLRELQQTHKDLPRVLPSLALFWADGQRTLVEIAQLVELEAGVRAPEYIADYFGILSDLGMMAW
jgi:hypothetical protein